MDIVQPTKYGHSAAYQIHDILYGVQRVTAFCVGSYFCALNAWQRGGYSLLIIHKYNKLVFLQHTHFGLLFSQILVTPLHM